MLHHCCAQKENVLHVDNFVAFKRAKEMRDFDKKWRESQTRNMIHTTTPLTT